MDHPGAFWIHIVNFNIWKIGMKDSGDFQGKPFALLVVSVLLLFLLYYFLIIIKDISYVGF